MGTLSLVRCTTWGTRVRRQSARAATGELDSRQDGSSPHSSSLRRTRSACGSPIAVKILHAARALDRALSISPRSRWARLALKSEIASPRRSPSSRASRTRVAWSLSARRAFPGRAPGPRDCPSPRFRPADCRSPAPAQGRARRTRGRDRAGPCAGTPRRGCPASRPPPRGSRSPARAPPAAPAARWPSEAARAGYTWTRGCRGGRSRPGGRRRGALRRAPRAATPPAPAAGSGRRSRSVPRPRNGCRAGPPRRRAPGAPGPTAAPRRCCSIRGRAARAHPGHPRRRGRRTGRPTPAGSGSSARGAVRPAGWWPSAERGQAGWTGRGGAADGVSAGRASRTRLETPE